MISKSVLLPDSSCLICQKSLEDIDGKRIIAQKLRGVCLSNHYRGGGNPDYPYKSVTLYDNASRTYAVTWGEKDKFTDTALNRVRDSFLSGKHPWFCQKCGVRTCSVCDEPINDAVGSDVIYDNGCTSHIPILGVDTGCINLDCKKYKYRNSE